MSIFRAGLWLVAASLGLISGCEAPLNLDGVEREQGKSLLRFDQLQDAATHAGSVVVVGANGTVLRGDGGGDWQRQQLPGGPALIGITACGTHGFAALDHDRRVWLSSAGKQWQAKPIATEESPLAIACDARDRLWVSASFSTLLVSADGGGSWESLSQDEDLTFGTLQFVDERVAVATGEFGALLISEDGGDSWERAADLPREFYPLAAHFRDRNNGWVAGLNGVVMATVDGGDSWQREATPGQAPIYRLAEHRGQLYAAGDNGTLLRRLDTGSWERVAEAPRVLAYLRPLLSLPDGRLLIGGGGGALAAIETVGGALAQQGGS